MRVLPFFVFTLFLTGFAHADLADSCSITDKTICPLNSDSSSAEFLVMLPNYQYCGVQFLSDTYPTHAVLEDFNTGLYVTSGPRWDLVSVLTGWIEDNLVYPVGPDPLFATFFSVYTEDGSSLSNYIASKLGTSYRPNPTVALVGIPCGLMLGSEQLR